MSLIEIYIQEVTRRLPEKSRSDIGLELSSTIEDMLPENYTEEDVKAVLSKLGHPAILANGYRERPMYLIGPRYYDTYISLLKMVIPIAITVAVIFLMVEYFVHIPKNEDIVTIVISLLTKGIGGMVDVALQVFFWLTLVFAIIERVNNDKGEDPLSLGLTKWTPDELKNIAYIPKKKEITKLEVFFSFLWIAIWATLYFYANQLLGVYEKGIDGLQHVTAALNQDVLLHYWIIVVGLICLEIILALLKFIKGQWTYKLAIYNTVVQLIAALVFIIIISNPNLFLEEFIIYVANIFKITVGQMQAWGVGGIIVIIILSTIAGIFEGFQKARIR